MEHGLILERYLDGQTGVNVPRVAVKHRPVPFDWSNSKDGARELSLNAAHACMKAAGYNGRICFEVGQAFYMAHVYLSSFGHRFIFNAPSGGDIIPWPDLLAWVTATGLLKVSE